jgi:hypothetical protein
VDVTAAGSGTGASAASGAVSTTSANDLLLGASYVSTSTAGPGSGFKSRIITSPDGDIVEDEIVAASGSYNATASVAGSGSWIMQMVAFKAAGSATPAALTQPKK